MIILLEAQLQIIQTRTNETESADADATNAEGSREEDTRDSNKNNRTLMIIAIILSRNLVLGSALLRGKRVLYVMRHIKMPTRNSFSARSFLK